MQGVLIVIGGVFVAAMFLVLYIRTTVAERRAAMLQEQLDKLREQSPGGGPG